MAINISTIGSIASSGRGIIPPSIEEASFYHTTITVADGNANAFIYQPYDINNPPEGGWPLIIFFNGDGTSNNNTALNSNQSMSTSDNLTYTHNVDLFGFRMMVSTIVIKVNGTPVAWGNIGGLIEGTGVSGLTTNFDHDAPSTNSSPTISVTFSSSQAGNTITCDYIRTSMLIEGVPRWINFGDTLDNRCIFIGIQNVNNSNDFNRDYWDKTVEYAWNNFTINPNRISAAGISRGGRQIIDQFAEGANTSVLKTRYQFWIDETTGVVYTSSGAGRVESGLASLVVGTASYAGTFTASNYTDIGIAIVHGTGDGTLTNNTPSFANSLGGNNEPPFILNISGAGHTRDVWDGKCYKRLYRVGEATGSLTTADWDWVDFILKYSKNAIERATLFVEQAEKRRYGTEKDIIDYRHALRQVNALSSSDEKTALLARLSTLKDDIDNGGTRWVINFHNTGNDESSPYNNIGSSTAGTIITNIVDFDGNSSGLDVELDTNPGVGVAAISSSRRSHTGGFTLKANNAGLGLGGWPPADFIMTDVPSGTYTIRLYHNVGLANFSTIPEISATINSETKVGYSGINTLIGYIEFTGVPHTALSSFSMARNTNDTYITIMELYKHP